MYQARRRTLHFASGKGEFSFLFLLFSAAVRRRRLKHCFGKFPTVSRKLQTFLFTFLYFTFCASNFCFSLSLFTSVVLSTAGSPSRVVFVTRINRRALRICRPRHAFRWSRRMKNLTMIRMIRRRTASCLTIMNTIRNMAKVFGQFNCGTICFCMCVFVSLCCFLFRRHFTREALPRLDNYRNMMSIQAAYRPTLDELHNATLMGKVSTHRDWLSLPLSLSLFSSIYPSQSCSLKSNEMNIFAFKLIAVRKHFTNVASSCELSLHSTMKLDSLEMFQVWVHATITPLSPLPFHLVFCCDLFAIRKQFPSATKRSPG